MHFLSYVENIIPRKASLFHCDPNPDLLEGCLKGTSYLDLVTRGTQLGKNKKVTLHNQVQLQKFFSVKNFLTSNTFFKENNLFRTREPFFWKTTFLKTYLWARDKIRTPLLPPPTHTQWILPETLALTAGLPNVTKSEQ